MCIYIQIKFRGFAVVVSFVKYFFCLYTYTLLHTPVFLLCLYTNEYPSNIFCCNTNTNGKSAQLNRTTTK